jgi:GNAT superfamily N-acetyltransferase
MPGDIRIHPLGPDRADDFVRLFGPQGACFGCWCMFFRLSPALREGLSARDRRRLMLERIAAGPPPGLLAYREGVPAGWLQIGPRSDVPQWNNPRRATTPLADTDPSDPGAWAISCFYFAKSVRGQGLSHLLVAEGVRFARKSGARMIEASPMEAARRSTSPGLFVGSASVFLKAGFTEVARQKPGRPLMRKVL